MAADFPETVGGYVIGPASVYSWCSDIRVGSGVGRMRRLYQLTKRESGPKVSLRDPAAGGCDLS